jgi:adenosine kinase
MDIIVTGSIAYDYLMRFPGHFSKHFMKDDLHQISVSFLVEDMTRHWGGVAANISYTLGLLGMKPKLMGTVGKDFSDYRAWLERAGVDTSTVRQHDDVFCSSFFVNTDLDNNQIASFYSGAMAFSRNYRLSDVYDGTPDLVVVSPNDPQAMSLITQECRDRGLRFLYDPSQQIPRLDGETLRRDMQGAFAMTVNAFEASMLCEKTGMTIDDLRREIEFLVITQGARGSHIYIKGEATEIPAMRHTGMSGDSTDIYEHGQLIEIPIVPVEPILDPTGVGDAFRAGLICGLANALPTPLTGQMGALCAAYVLEQVGPQSHHFTTAEFITRFRQHFDDQGRLNTLL